MIPGSFGLNRVESSGIVGEFASQRQFEFPFGNSRREGRADTVQSRAELRLLASCASRHNASNACIVLVDTIHAFHSNNILLVPSSKSQIRPRIRMEAKGTDEGSDVSQSCHGGSLSESIMGFDSPSHPYLHCLLPM